MIYAHIPRPKPMTNADRIRAMTDEELWKFLKTPYCTPEIYEKCDLEKRKNCNDCLWDWLKQPYGGADNVS